MTRAALSGLDHTVRPAAFWSSGQIGAFREDACAMRRMVSDSGGHEVGDILGCRRDGRGLSFSDRVGHPPLQAA